MAENFKFHSARGDQKTDAVRASRRGINLYVVVGHAS